MINKKTVSVYKAIAISAAVASALIGLALLVKKLVENRRLCRCECEYEEYDDNDEEIEKEPEVTAAAEFAADVDTDTDFDIESEIKEET